MYILTYSIIYRVASLKSNFCVTNSERVAVWDFGPRPLGPKEIDWLIVPLGKAITLLTDHLFTG